MKHKTISMVQAHPWHGISPGERAPEVLTAFIEIVPLDTVKYEIDKESGHLKVDRPHKFSSLCPTLYGFIPRSYCGKRVANLACERCGYEGLRGDGDPLDICVLTERTIARNGILVTARPIGGLRLIDRDEVDDKIISVLAADPVFSGYTDISEAPEGLINRLKHYFLTYKEPPDAPIGSRRNVEISDMYGSSQAMAVIRESFADYEAEFRGSSW